MRLESHLCGDSMEQIREQEVAMKRFVNADWTQPLISLVPDVSFAQVPFWFNGTLRQLKMDLWLPKRREKRQPTIVWICGGAFQQVDRHLWMGEMLYFARQGFTIASVEYRTSMEANWPAPVCDVKSAIRYLRAHADELCVDPERIAVMGESAGGYLASFLGVTGGTKEFDRGQNLEFNSRVQAVVDYYGLVEISSGQAENLSDGDTVIVKGNVTELLMGCEEKDDPQLYSRATVASWVDRQTPPFLILHGAEDPLVNVKQSERLYQILRDAGVPAELDVYQGATHGDDLFYQSEAKSRVVDFLRKHLE